MAEQPALASIRAAYPFEPRRLHVAGGTISYVDEGAGRPALLLHGNPTWSFYYRRLIAALRQHMRVIAPDHLGCGLSDKPQSYPYRLADHIDNLAHLVRHLDLPEVDLVLHDWGGAIGMGLATRRALRVRRIVVLNTAAFLSPRVPLRIAVCKLPLFGPLAVRGLNAFARLATVMAVERPMADEARRGYLLPYGSWDERVAILRFVQDIPLRPTHPTWQTVAEIEQRLPMFRDTPMLIVWGGRDWCFSDHFLAGWLERFPQAEVLRIDDAGHYVLEDAPEIAVPAILRFLTE